MTNAVTALCHLAATAGFTRTKPDNLRSQAVLRRCLFSEQAGSQPQYLRFEGALVS